MKLLLFDVDATLISTGGAGLRALNRAFKKLLDLESAMLDIAPHGKTDPAIVREVFQKRMKEKSATEGVIAEVIDMYVQYLREEVERSRAGEETPRLDRRGSDGILGDEELGAPQTR